MSRMDNLYENLSSVCEELLELVDIFTSKETLIKEFAEEGQDIRANFLRAEPCEDPEYVYWVYFCNLCQKEERSKVVIEETWDYVGDCPHEEDDCFKKYGSRKVSQALILQLRNTYGKEPKGAQLYVKSELGGGGYYTVACKYTTAEPTSVAYFYFVEGNLPSKWSPAAKRFLEN